MTVVKDKKLNKTSGIDTGVDFKILADEYTNLMKFRYEFVLENLEDINFRFDEDVFFHLLGFHKIKDATIVELVEVKKMISKADFFRNVVKGNINYDYLELNNILNEKDSIENIKTYKGTTGYKSELGKVISNRWFCFSQAKILSIFGQKLVLDFDKDGCNSKIEADRIFFQYLQNKKRNVNLFIKYSSKDKTYHPVTFFMEDNPNSFIKKADGSSQKRINILAKRIIDIHTNKDIEFEILWANVRDELKSEPEYFAQKDLFTTFSNERHIESKELINKINIVKKQVSNIPDIYKNMKDKGLALECIRQYKKYVVTKTKEEKEDIETFFMELEECIDIDDEATHSQFSGNCLRKVLKRYDQTIRYESMLPLLLKLEVKEVKYIYGKFFDVTNWSDTFVRTLIDEYDCYDNKLSLADIENLVEKMV